MIIGNGSMEDVIAGLHAEAEAGTGEEVAASAVTAAADPDAAEDWRNLEASYYPLICTSRTDASDALVCAMLREVLPLRSSALFYFSGLPQRFRAWVESLANECGASLEWSDTALWECAPGCFVENDRPDFRAALQRCSRLYDEPPAPVPAPAQAAVATEAEAEADSAPELEVAPLRLEHVGLVVAHWSDNQAGREGGRWGGLLAPRAVRGGLDLGVCGTFILSPFSNLCFVCVVCVCSVRLLRVSDVVCARTLPPGRGRHLRQRHWWNT